VKKIALAVAVPALAALSLAACQSSSGSGTNVTPSASQAAAVAAGEAQGCLQQGSFLTHSGRVKIKTCVENLVPAANRPNAAFCAGGAVLKHHTHAARENALAACLVKYGQSAAASPGSS
jgi:predicted small secreted protein